jgi:2-polyprenyl-3-methyl-5-hydroxy-6-metoxy-1,4-benzoquinol methylase
MAYLSKLARKKKLAFFIDSIPLNAAVLEVGCGSNWVKEYMLQKGYAGYSGIDMEGNPDIKGNINNWQALGLKAGTYDCIIAFEVTEHDDIWNSCFTLLKNGGTMKLTTPVPAADWLLKILEWVGLNQKRTSPHTHLMDVRKVPGFTIQYYKKIMGLSQWAILQKP